MNTKRRTAAEIIAFHFSSDIRDISDCRYQPTRYANPAIYSMGEYYYAAPSNNKAPTNFQGEWERIGEYYGRTVFRVHMNKVK